MSASIKDFGDLVRSKTAAVGRWAINRGNLFPKQLQIYGQLAAMMNQMIDRLADRLALRRAEQKRALIFQRERLGQGIIIESLKRLTNILHVPVEGGDQMFGRFDLIVFERSEVDVAFFDDVCDPFRHLGDHRSQIIQCHRFLMRLPVGFVERNLLEAFARRSSFGFQFA